MDFSNYLFRCHPLALLMTEPKENEKKQGLPAVTTQTYLRKVWIKERFGREEEIESKYITKGLAVEEASITLYARYKKEMFVKNDQRIQNRFLTGLPDLFQGKDIYHAEFIPDIKSSWDIYTFFANLGTNGPKKASTEHYWQLHGYFGITGAKRGAVAHCLIDTPSQLISDEQRRLQWKMGVATSEDPLYIEACAALEKNMRFEDMPIDSRVIEQPVTRNDEDIERLYVRIQQCREFLNRLEEAYLKSRRNLTAEYFKP